MLKKKKIPDQDPVINHIHSLKYKICVSGAAETGHCADGTFEKSVELGRQIAKKGMILVTGATTGTPYWAAKGAKEEGGIVIGISPASSKIAHIKTYRLPIDYHDLIIYTGFGYSGRNLLLVRSSDAVVTVCGRMGTLNEFTIAFEDDKLSGVLQKTGGTADMVEEIVGKSHRGPGRIVYDSDPGKLLDKILKELEREERVNGIKGRIL